ncbi:hypothetical protein [Fictibacillus arsenicus]|uniref:Uncharacterized protein n=1 Tax=Fictibacillus arsenicus TaxID=255247 RepID=A0A1V3G738_9BACL|nr:hypothetical protein [Fictibacillus arsenicus]OOE10823.1 hypothetical protein UN64_15880 [Fictibacillus arsenicus]
MCESHASKLAIFILTKRSERNDSRYGTGLLAYEETKFGKLRYSTSTYNGKLERGSDALNDTIRKFIKLIPPVDAIDVYVKEWFFEPPFLFEIGGTKIRLFKIRKDLKFRNRLLTRLAENACELEQSDFIEIR